MRALVQISGGIGSALAWKRAVESTMFRSVHAVFADTGEECPDLHRFLAELEAQFGTITRLSAGMSVWELFHKERMLGSTRVDLCSRKLKREVLDRFAHEHFDPKDTVLVFGFGPEECHRWAGVAARLAPWPTLAPMCARPHLGVEKMRAEIEALGIEIPALYREGFPHNNCGGACVKAGHAQWKHLLEKRPETFLRWEREEERFRANVGNHSILRDRRGGETRPLPLSEFRRRVEEERCAGLSLFDWGEGCACMDDGTMPAREKWGTE